MRVCLENAKGRKRNGKDKHIKPNWTRGLMTILMERLTAEVHKRTYGPPEFWIQCIVTIG